MRNVVLKIADDYNISIGNIKMLVFNFFDKEKCVLHYKNWQLYLRLKLKTKKKIHRVLELRRFKNRRNNILAQSFGVSI